jgi:hypothetical protein
VPHTVTVNRDMARALITLAPDDRAWGRPWRVPSPPAVTVREVARRYAPADRPPIKLIRISRFAMRVAGLVLHSNNNGHGSRSRFSGTAWAIAVISVGEKNG